VWRVPAIDKVAAEVGPGACGCIYQVLSRASWPRRLGFHCPARGQDTDDQPVRPYRQLKDLVLYTFLLPE
jgi:hypothetical protein